MILESNYLHRYDELLRHLGSIQSSARYPAITAFSYRRGSTYDGALMVIGRAVNGWNGRALLSALTDKRTRHQLIAASRSVDHSCELRWVVDMWNEERNPDGSTRYSTKRSAFWRMARAVLQGVTGRVDLYWSSALAWTNLYKLAPYDRGNPSARLQNLQRSYCIEMLAQEMEILKPRRVLFMTGQWS